MRCLIILIMSTTFAMAQDHDLIEPIATDRPDQTETPSIVPMHMLQVETGFSYEQSDKNSSSLIAPTVLWKYGVNENFELRLITTVTTLNDSIGNKTGLNPVAAGFKVGLSEEIGIFPKTSFIGHLSVPDWASNNFKVYNYAASFRFTMQHTWHDKLSLGYNIGAAWDGESPQATFLYTMTTSYAITAILGAYIEIYGFAPENATSFHSIDGGVTYLLSNNAMIDLSAGFGVTENAPDYFVSAGFSFRI